MRHPRGATYWDTSTPGTQRVCRAASPRSRERDAFLRPRLGPERSRVLANGQARFGGRPLEKARSCGTSLAAHPTPTRVRRSTKCCVAAGDSWSTSSWQPSPVSMWLNCQHYHRRHRSAAPANTAWRYEHDGPPAGKPSTNASSPAKPASDRSRVRDRAYDCAAAPQHAAAIHHCPT